MVYHVNYRAIIVCGILPVLLVIGVALGQKRDNRRAVPARPMAVLVAPYDRTAQLTGVPFGAHSHWFHPWRAYQETVPASTFLDGTGINFDVDNMPGDVDVDLIVRMLAQHGLRHLRLEIGWGQLDYGTQSHFVHAVVLRQILGAARRYGMRPLILLNAHQGIPCPLLRFARTLAAPARAGDTFVQLTDTRGLVVGYSGLSDLSGYWAAEAMVTAISGHTVALSKPLPRAIGSGRGVIGSGTAVPFATLRYRPFGPLGTHAYSDTIAGWQRYVGVVSGFVEGALGTQGSPDKGFDLEIWNELTFGSAFLDINNYDTLRPSAYPPAPDADPVGPGASPVGPGATSIYGNLVAATVSYVAAHLALFAGVQISDGFANTIPWPASSREPARIDAISKHPYMPRRYYNIDGKNDDSGGEALDAFGRADRSGFIPSYTALFPEYFAEDIKTETIMRDAGPIATTIRGVAHGRDARIVAGRVLPCPVWITEAGIPPDRNNVTGRAAALALKAVTTARYETFYLNKGVTQLDLFGAFGGDPDYGLVQDNFIAYARQHRTYPGDDMPYTSPSLQVTSRIAAVMRVGLDATLTRTRSLTVDAIGDTHNHDQFVGDGTAAHPTLYDRDVFAFLPYQVNATRFVVPYYVMTRDVRRPLAPERFTIVVAGLHGAVAAVAAYDPIKDRAVLVTVDGRSPTTLTLTLPTADYPYLLTIQDGPADRPSSTSRP